MISLSAFIDHLTKVRDAAGDMPVVLITGVAGKVADDVVSVEFAEVNAFATDVTPNGTTDTQPMLCLCVLGGFVDRCFAKDEPGESIAVEAGEDVPKETS